MGHVVARTVDVIENKDVFSADGELTAAEFESLSRLLKPFADFDRCYCAEDAPLDGPTERVAVSRGEVEHEVFIYMMPVSELPTELAELLALFGAIESRLRDTT